MTELSPAAQAVLDAFLRAPCDNKLSVAAALRAAVELVVPDNYHCFTGHLDWDQGMEARNDTVRENLLAIATELENHAN